MELVQQSAVRPEGAASSLDPVLPGQCPAEEAARALIQERLEGVPHAELVVDLELGITCEGQVVVLDCSIGGFQAE